MRSLWLAKKGNRSTALKLIPHPGPRRVDFEIIETAKPSQVGDGTVARGSATCPCCGYTTPVASVRTQLKARSGGAADARLFCVVTTHADAQGRFYRPPSERDFQAIEKAAEELERRKKSHRGDLPLVPDEPLPLMSGVFNAPLYGHKTWGSLFTPRQLLALTTLSRLVLEAREKLATSEEVGLADAVQAALCIVVDRQANTLTSLSRWHLTGQKIEGLFARQAIPMVWDFAEANSFSGSTGDFDGALDWVSEVCVAGGAFENSGHVERCSANAHPLPNDSAQALVTDPPYYNAVPYADLSDFFYVWLRRTLPQNLLASFSEQLSPKEDEICEMSGWDPVRYPHKTGDWFEKQMKKAMAECRRVLIPNGIGVVVFAHKSTAGWEAQLQAMVDAGWIITGSWPIDTEMGARLRAQDSAVLASSIHLVCRPRADGEQSVGDWREVLAELPVRIHQWLPRSS